VAKTNGNRHFLAHLYQEKKRIWPLKLAPNNSSAPVYRADLTTYMGSVIVG